MKPRYFTLATVLILALSGCKEEPGIDRHSSQTALSNRAPTETTSKAPAKKEVFEVSEDALPQCTPIFWEQ